jgi:hypothetical protein
MLKKYFVSSTCAHALQFGLKDILKPMVLDVWKYMLLTKSLI